MQHPQRVVLVTGASRGVGRGVARALAPGSVVYLTARSSLEAVTADVEAAGGTAVAVSLDQADDAAIAALFDRIANDHGRLDILVNNATALSPPPGETPFWERDLAADLAPLTVGARSHYVAAWYAARLMAPARTGLIVNISSPGSQVHMAGLHAATYGMDKAASDKMIFEIAQDLKPAGVAAVSLWLGVVMTELLSGVKEAAPEFIESFAPSYESPDFAGRVVDALWRSPDLMSMTGQVLWASQVAQALGVLDVDGSQPLVLDDWMGTTPTYRSVASTWAEHQAARTD